MRLLGDARPQDLQAEGVTITPHEQPRMFVVEHAKQATLAEWSRRGIAQVQDGTAAHVVEECEVLAGQSVLDRCCGFGTKALQLAEKVGPSGTVVAVDPNRERIEGLRRLIAGRARRLPNRSSTDDKNGTAGASPSQANGVVTVATAGWMKDVDYSSKTFDRVLVDVPCSNSGVLARRPEARYRQDQQTLRSLEKLQRDILLDTAAHVAPSGLLIYSTCSIWPEENEHIAQWFLKQHPFKLLRQHATLPSLDADPARYHDGGYFAVFART
jgi:16S rRNA (cytosine967-C5)-methyltransferase